MTGRRTRPISTIQIGRLRPRKNGGAGMADIGLVGLGVMGANLSLNMAEKGYSVAVYTRTTEKTDAFIAHAGNLAPKLVPCKTLAELAAAVTPPRPIVIMVKAGPPVDEQAEVLQPHLAKGDILIDAG